MNYRNLQIGALLLLCVLFLALSSAVKHIPGPIVMADIRQTSIDAFQKSIEAINTIDYKLCIETMGLGNKRSISQTHYIYKGNDYLRIEAEHGDRINVDIYCPDRIYEYYPSIGTAYCREKWKDGIAVPFQLEERLRDITVRGKYKSVKMERIKDKDAEVMRSVDEEEGKIFEHRIWLAQINGYRLPIREEYLTDGVANSVYEYEYISINKPVDPTVFELKSSEKLRIYNADGIPKLVKSMDEAEKLTGFELTVPRYIPKGFETKEIYAIPPCKTPAVLVTYIDSGETINFRQKYIHSDELSISNGEKIIKFVGRKFAVKKLDNERIEIKWVHDDIEFEICGPYTLKDEIIKMVQGICGIWITIE